MIKTLCFLQSLDVTRFCNENGYNDLFKSIVFGNAVILVVVCFWQKHLFVPKLAGMLDSSCTFQVQPLCGQGWWVPYSFDLYPKFPQCLPLNRNVFIFVHPCRPSEPNHSPLSDSLVKYKVNGDVFLHGARHGAPLHWKGAARKHPSGTSLVHRWGRGVFESSNSSYLTSAGPVVL